MNGIKTKAKFDNKEYKILKINKLYSWRKRGFKIRQKCWWRDRSIAGPQLVVPVDNTALNAAKQGGAAYCLYGTDVISDDESENQNL